MQTRMLALTKTCLHDIVKENTDPPSQPFTKAEFQYH